MAPVFHRTVSVHNGRRTSSVSGRRMSMGRMSMGRMVMGWVRVHTVGRALHGFNDVTKSAQ